MTKIIIRKKKQGKGGQKRTERQKGQQGQKSQQKKVVFKKKSPVKTKIIIKTIKKITKKKLINYYELLFNNDFD